MTYICQYKRGRRINLGKVGVITPAQAREKAIEVLNNLHKGIEPTAQKGINKPKTLLEFIENEYKPWVLSHHKRGDETMKTITRCFKKLFPKVLTEISPSILEQWRTKRLNEGIGNSTLNRNIATLKSVMTKATEWGFLDENPLKKLKLFKIDRSPKVRYLTLEEETRLRQTLFERDSQLKLARNSANQWRKARGYPLFPDFDESTPYDYLMPMVLLSINTGLRQGELFHLTWSMVDLAEHSIIISGEVTKNSNSRYIPMNNETIKILEQLHKKSDKQVELNIYNKSA